ncbi:hypothetical protein RRG08_064461 [Elysia crispata]|uniref:Uncharacterized protein n=1 Tax=Elysia crispata TaxID=231223 RepID=A0AAE0Y142_9GAST|nr:hypothetical protein RRG08_064461 [Elysia crispata]
MNMDDDIVDNNIDTFDVIPEAAVWSMAPMCRWFKQPIGAQRKRVRGQNEIFYDHSRYRALCCPSLCELSKPLLQRPGLVELAWFTIGFSHGMIGGRGRQ